MIFGCILLIDTMQPSHVKSEFYFCLDQNLFFVFRCFQKQQKMSLLVGGVQKLLHKEGRSEKIFCSELMKLLYLTILSFFFLLTDDGSQ